MMRVHLEGMGVTGSLLTYQLERHDVEFTWHDIEAERTAWRACTGAIYPAGKPGSLDFETHRRWLDWYEGMWPSAPYFEIGDFVFNHKSAPHGGVYKVEQLACGLRSADTRSLHFNAQRFVGDTRERHAGKRIGQRPDREPDRYIVTHGWSERRAHSYWGWARYVVLDYDKDIASGEVRPAFYFRDGRFVMAYAYPVPGTRWWYAGSSIIKQPRVERPLQIEDKYWRWKSNFERLSGGAVRVRAVGDIVQGWRPARSDDQWVTCVGPRLGNGQTIICPPLWNSGVRHFPHVWGEISTWLGITGETLDVVGTAGRN